MVFKEASPRKRDVMAYYDALGGRIYDVRYGLEQSAKYDVILSRSRIEPRDLVLDVGCGTGLLLDRITAFSIGVDISLRLLRRARKRIRDGQGLIRCDAEHLPFRGGIFNRVFAVTVIQNIARPESLLFEIMRVARGGAELVLTTLKRKTASEDFKRLVESSGLSVESLVEGEEVKDWIIFATNPQARRGPMSEDR